MAIPRAAKVHAERSVTLNGAALSHTPRVLARRKAVAKPLAKSPEAISMSTKPMTDHQRAIEMLREIEIDGLALSAQIDRIIQRYM